MIRGNAIYLICDPCQKAGEKDFGFKLAARDVIGKYTVYGRTKHTDELSKWLGKHKDCGGEGNPDHFMLGHLQERNADQPRIQVSSSIQQALNGSPS